MIRGTTTFFVPLLGRSAWKCLLAPTKSPTKTTVSYAKVVLQPNQQPPPNSSQIIVDNNHDGPHSTHRRTLTASPIQRCRWWHCNPDKTQGMSALVPCLLLESLVIKGKFSHVFLNNLERYGCSPSPHHLPSPHFQWQPRP